MVKLRILFGEVFKEVRESQLLTLRDVQQRSKVSIGYISEIERGQKEASSEVINALCNALLIGLDDLLLRCLDKLKTNPSLAHDDRLVMSLATFNASRPKYPENK